MFILMDIESVVNEVFFNYIYYNSTSCIYFISDRIRIPRNKETQVIL